MPPQNANVSTLQIHTRRVTVHNGWGRACECASPTPLMMVIINGSQLTCPKSARLTTGKMEGPHELLQSDPSGIDLAQGKLKGALSICLLVFLDFEAILKSNRMKWSYDMHVLIFQNLATIFKL